MPTLHFVSRPSAWAALLVASIAFPSAATADDKATCVAAASNGQTLRDAHKLIEAREAFRICAQQVCPSVVQTDCVSWLEATEKDLPSVIVSAKNAKGVDLTAVNVTIDGAPVLSSLDGRAIPMNPGPHKFHFQGADGSLDQDVVIHEGEHDRGIAVVLGAEEPLPPAKRTLRTVGIVVTSVGAVGLLAGAIAGGIAVSQKSAAQCTGNLCLTGPLDTAKHAAVAADAGLISGGVLGVAGIAMIIASTTGTHKPSASAVRVIPMVGIANAGVALEGSF